MSVPANPLDASQPPAIPDLFVTPQGLFDGERLPFPPVPASLAASLRPQDRTLFSTKALSKRPYHLAPFLHEVEAQPDQPAYAVVGFDGHGLNSWAVHYYLVSDGIGLFVQLPWGGAYVDPESARAEIAEMFDWSARLQSKVQMAAEQNKIPKGWRLQVAASRLGHAGWRWLVAGKDNAATPWNPAGGMKATLSQLLDDILVGNQVL